MAAWQTAARTAASYLRQCGNEVLLPEEADTAAAEILYSVLCRGSSTERPFPEKAKDVLAEYMADG